MSEHIYKGIVGCVRRMCMDVVMVLLGISIALSVVSVILSVVLLVKAIKSVKKK